VGSESSQKLGNSSFSGHETFVFRYSWLYKAASLIPDNKRLFSSDEAMVKLGVGKNMVHSIRHWALATKVLCDQTKSRGTELELTTLGKLLFADGTGDPFLEDSNTLWILHWNLANNIERATTWAWAFNLFPSTEFTRDGLTAFIRSEINGRGMKAPSEATLKRDIECFVRTYARSRNSKGVTLEDSLDCPLTELGLLTEDRSASLIRFTRGDRPTLSDEVFVSCLAEFWDQFARGRETLSFADIAFGFGSPGMVFRIDESSLMERLERLEVVTSGALYFGDTSGLKQVYRLKSTGLSLLSQYYQCGTVSSESGESK